MKKNMFFVIAVLLFTTTSCRKDQVFGQNLLAVPAKPQIVRYLDNGKSAEVSYNGTTVILNTVSATDNVGTGLLLLPPSRPADWNRDDYGQLIPTDLAEPTESWDRSTVYYVKINWLSQTQYIGDLLSTSMQWHNGSAPGGNNAYYYIPGTATLRPGIVYPAKKIVGTNTDNYVYK